MGWKVRCILAVQIPKTTSHRTAHPLVDRTGRIFAVLAGQPDGDDSYAVSASEAYTYIKACGAATYFPPEMRCHCRGLFAAINVGLNLGKGATVPSWLDNKKHTPLVSQLLGNSHVIRMANFASSAFATWAPKLYRHYVDNNTCLRTRFPHLWRPFPQTVFTGAAFNFSRVCTYKHRDICNLPFGWCAVQLLGRFDATEGGHLILWDVNLVVEFLAGSLILLPPHKARLTC
ncbi:hypothetical protein DFH08DRAFT_692418 [Mycena albidolilacea]|uniref:Uncharacterized protein n=1 Tax=Mycena albidolilacea TaxID=1033008 RepID=A0AAD7EWM1_9AGAR|nr:hypothetical protein DFH08DRAFT_692418 [Mycena albidolilacea]